MTQLEPRRGRATCRPVAVPIVKATDLGSVQVLKHGNRFLLTDSFGDIHPDSRGLGLYDGDTRVLACSVLRIGGIRPVLLQTIRRGELPRRDPDDEPVGRSEPGAPRSPAGRAGRCGRIGISRERLMAPRAFAERLKVVNHAAREADVPVELELGVDGSRHLRGPRLIHGRVAGSCFRSR
jgi:hypothetical protein